MAVSLTIFTPTYNRANLLRHGYEALKRQSCKDFIWLIIDDGSADNTAEVVRSFQAADNGFEIRYIYKENGGLHTAYNTAIESADTELCMCIDSDDMIADEAVAQIIDTWSRVKCEECAGLVGLNKTTAGKITGSILPQQQSRYINLNEYDAKHRWSGDRKLVIRTDLYKSVAPMPSFAGEKNFNPQYMHIQIAQDYTFYVVNEVFCVVDYQDTGMSAGIFRQYLNSPNSFAEYRRLKMTVRPNSFFNIIRNAIHYDSSCILAGKPREIITRSPMRFITASMAPAGLALSLYIRWQVSKQNSKAKKDGNE